MIDPDTPTWVLVDVSFSKARNLARCPRSVYWDVEGSRDGWKPDAPDLARRAYQLKQLTTFSASLAIGLHECAVQIARAYRDGRHPPPFESLREHLRRRLNALWAADRRAYERDPRRGGFARERWYNEPLSADAVQLLRARMDAALRRLYRHPRWELVRAAGRGDILVIDALDHLPVTFDGLPRARLWAAPDLAFVSRDPIEIPGYGIRVPGPTGVLIDWKSGQQDERGADAVDQLAVFGWYLRDRLHVPMGPLGYVACVGDISTTAAADGGPMLLVGPKEIERGAQFIRRTVAELASYADERGRLVKERMPPVLGACRFCAYPEVCHPDLEAGRPT